MVPGSSHTPEEIDEMSYSENKIRAVCRDKLYYPPASIDSLIAALRAKDDHVHDFTETDTITVREFREAWDRQFPGMYPLQIPAADRRATFERFLRDISDHREPQYVPGNLYRTLSGGVYLYTEKGTFRVLGVEVSRKAIAGPLEEMP
jgi:hypothetical protein